MFTQILENMERRLRHEIQRELRLKSFDTPEAAQAELERRIEDWYADAAEEALSRKQGW
jgi:hypothetical protein